ncbi:MBL fold metallo-hydrolase [Thiomicrorhabdus sediminis]|uniref:MBL fold metallo-hydrolase n=1 Tax=Thiomicrorhabdus sediminis TaxID=2580412 RepID=A0A4P9K5R1_9GAMM|nr:MBL fold metallo-hydrolase [Thiomicrorhabdus sediminis]QCU90364.1 MBL fold metallo-hydrolase [Thiomicrorhabdus sediminis]
MKIRQLFDYDTWTYTYLLWDETSKEAAIIDSVKEQVERDMQHIKELGLNLKYALETHIHADHITAAGPIRERTGAKIVVHKNSESQCADILAVEGDEFKLGEQTIKVLHTPGHTNNDITYLIDGAAFTGDTLLVRDCGRTDFQLGSNEAMYHSLTEKLFKLAEDTMVFPAHDYKGFSQSTIGEEKQFNNRVGNAKSYQDFSTIMDNLNLPRPKRIDIAVPGNMQCGLKDNPTVQ